MEGGGGREKKGMIGGKEEKRKVVGSENDGRIGEKVEIGKKGNVG